VTQYQSRTSRPSDDRACAVLIIARSGRQLAEAARAAGYVPHVIDLFGDTDTEAAAAGCAVVESGPDLSFRAASVWCIVERIEQAAGPLPIIWGSGWEGQAHVLAALARRRKVLGCSPSTVFAVNDPPRLAAVLRGLDILHPRIGYVHDPNSAVPWLVKQRGSCGGVHVRRAHLRSIPGQREYLQAETAGRHLSVAFVAGPAGVTVLGVCEALYFQSDSEYPFRYSGSISNPAFRQGIEAELQRITVAVSEAFLLNGLCGIDFILADTGELILLEINPRPTATFDLLAKPGEVFHAHVAAAAGGKPAIDTYGDVRASVVCFAEQSFIVPDALNWPAWVSDRPRAGTRIEAGMPICTVRASADRTEDTRALAARRYRAVHEVIAAVRLDGRRERTDRHAASAPQKSFRQTDWGRNP